jgi:uracil-DNA glycosylase
VKQVSVAPSFPAWQKAARTALQRGFEPDRVAWQQFGHEAPGLDLFEEAEPSSERHEVRLFRVPRKFLEIAKQVALHSDERRWTLLYRLLWRITHGEPKLLEIVIDPDVARALEWP